MQLDPPGKSKQLRNRFANELRPLVNNESRAPFSNRFPRAMPPERENFLEIGSTILEENVLQSRNSREVFVMWNNASRNAVAVITFNCANSTDVLTHAKSVRGV